MTFTQLQSSINQKIINDLINVEFAANLYVRDHLLIQWLFECFDISNMKIEEIYKAWDRYINRRENHG